MKLSRSLMALLVAVLGAMVGIGSAAGGDSRYIRKVESATQVIVFMHGVLGDGTSTWTNGAAYWPELLTKDPAFDGSSVYVYEYPSNLIKDTFSIDEIAENMRLQFEADGVSTHREIVFLAHSMGGLATRAYLLKYRGVASRVRLIYFFSTPTTGSEIADLAKLISKNPQFGKMKPMQSADYLADLQRTWLAADFPFPSYCAYEKQKAYGMLIVTQASAASLCNKHLDPIDADHISIVKPAGTGDVSYLAFKAAFKEAPHLTNREGCFSSTSIFGNDNNAAQVDQGICPDEVDPQRALRIRYVWLDSTSTSLLMAGQISGNLEKSLGSRPYVIENAVTNELKTIIAKFGTPMSNDKVALSSGVEGLRDTASSKDESFTPSRRNGKIKLYEFGNAVSLPELSAYQAIIGSLDYPGDFSMYYAKYDGSDQNEKDILEGVTLWRYFTADDAKGYSASLVKLRDWLAKERSRLGPKITEDFFSPADLAPKKNAAPGLPAELVAMQYFARAGWPDDFLVASGGAACGEGSFGLSIWTRELYVQVAVIENGQGKGTLPVSALTADEIITDGLRVAGDDSGWTRTKYQFPVPGLSEGETVIVPLQLELRAPDATIPDKDAVEGSKAQYLGIQKYAKSVLVQRQDNQVIYKKRKEAFKASSFPTGTPYTYGPRVKLVSAQALGRDIALRQFDPAKVWARFGSEEGSCPSIYVKSIDGSLQSHGRILTGARGAMKVRTESLVHSGAALAIEIAEDEPEISRLEEIRIFRVDSPDREVLMYQESDRVIAPGLPLRIETPLLRDAENIRIEVRGFYRTFPEMMVEMARREAEDAERLH
jgi:pimeloyl-ACP methyl ester carboxylesterase